MGSNAYVPTKGQQNRKKCLMHILFFLKVVNPQLHNISITDSQAKEDSILWPYFLSSSWDIFNYDYTALTLSTKEISHSLWRPCQISTNLLKGTSDKSSKKAAALLLFPWKDILCTFTEDRLAFCRVRCCINNFFGLPFTLSCCHCRVVIFMCFSASAPDGCCHKSPIPTHSFSTYIKAQRQWEVGHMPGNVTVLMCSYLCMFIIKYDIYNHRGFTFTPGYFMA